MAAGESAQQWQRGEFRPEEALRFLPAGPGDSKLGGVGKRFKLEKAVLAKRFGNHAKRRVGLGALRHRRPLKIEAGPGAVPE